MTRFHRAVLASSILLALAAPAQAAQRVFVSSGGSDANPCSFAAPCRGFQAAHTNVDPGGEIVALDAAGFGAVTITKSVTITTNPGYYAGIAAAAGNAITIATAGVAVTLRGLNINGVGGVNGVNMTAGASLSIDNCVFSNFTTNGILVSNVAKVQLNNVLVRNNGSTGMRLGTGVSGDIIGSQFLDNGVLNIYANDMGHLAIRDSVSSGSAFGLGADGTATVVSVIQSEVTHNGASGVETHDTSSVYVAYSQVSHNNVGLNNGGGTIGSMQNNAVVLNGTNTTGVITPTGGI